jgi:cytochrome o ubiquinol oxidase subunit 3
MHYPDSHHDVYSKTIFGFWVYLLTDFMLFATFFAVHAVLFDSNHGGPTGKQLFVLPFTLIQSILLLSASFTSGIGGVCAHRRNKSGVIFFFLLTFLLGMVFMGMEMSEFSHLIKSGNSWQRSAFLSSFFNLVGMHGLHMIFALLWTLVLLVPVFRFGITDVSVKRLTCLKMFWQFINIVWVFIFSLVYLMGGR